jgi:hypothetical protein
MSVSRLTDATNSESMMSSGDAFKSPELIDGGPVPDTKRGFA